jgi:hypothetical protein
VDDDDHLLGELRRSVERTDVDRGRSDPANLETVVRIGKRRRAMRVGFSWVAALVIAVGVVVPLYALQPLGRSPKGAVRASPTGDASPMVSLAPPVHPGWLTYQLPAEGVSIQAPLDWHLVEDPVPGLSHPSILFDMASYYQPPAPSSGCAPEAALRDLPSDQVLSWLSEYQSPPDSLDFAPRADPFPLENLASYECVGRLGYLTTFRDQGRYFQLMAVFGPNASDALRQSVIDSLGSLIVDPVGGTGPAWDAAASWQSPPVFDAEVGWETESSSPSSIGRDAVPVTWASNIPFAQADLDTMSGGAVIPQTETFPQQTIDSLTLGEVVIVADLPLPGLTAPVDSANFATRAVPLDVHDAIGPVEGDKQFVLTAAINGQRVEVRFFYGTDSPTDDELAIAQQELNGLVVPSLPPSG